MCVTLLGNTNAPRDAVPGAPNASRPWSSLCKYLITIFGGWRLDVELFKS